MINLKDIEEKDEAITHILKTMVDEDWSDVHISPNLRITAEVSLQFTPITELPITRDEAFELCDAIYGSDTGSAKILSGQDLDFDKEIKYKVKGDSLTTPHRFRVNITSITSRGSICPAISIRKLYADIPKWSDFNFEEYIWDNFRPENGMIIVTGPTGSGKSTLLASGIRRIIEERQNEKIVTLEDPIEYTYEKYNNIHSFVEQSSKSTNFKDFQTPMKSILRRKPSIVMVGEARDKETIRASLYVAQTGHLVYTTMHTNGVPETFKRMISEFPIDEQHSRLADIVTNTRMIVSQQIHRSTEGKRVAIREILVITPTVKSYLEKADVTNIASVARKLTDKFGQSMAAHAAQMVEKGLLRQDQYEQIAQEFKNN